MKVINNLAPICLFTYNRFSETKQTVEALKKNPLAKESDLFIFSDGSKNNETSEKVKKVRHYLKSVKGFKSVNLFISEGNKGLAKSIIEGVSKIFESFDTVIILEDDIETHPNFLNFMNEALDFYKNDKSIQSINGYSLEIESQSDVYFQKRTFSWGWATWKEYWSSEIFDRKLISEHINENVNLLKLFNKYCGDDIAGMLLDSLNRKNNSWYVRWAFNHFVNNRYAVYPTKSLVNNIGFVEESTHCQGINTYVSNFENEEKRKIRFTKVILAQEEEKQFLSYFKKWYKLKFRLKLLKNKHGRRLLFNEIKNRI
jgi:GR25 family glycosyltransferase involved in LPS biosynthesis